MLQRTPNQARHILAFAQTLKGGGVERALMRLARGWQHAGRKVTLVIGSTEGPLAAEVPSGVTVRHLGSADYETLARAMPGIVQAESPDLIFCPGNHYSSIAGYTRLRLGRRTPPIVGKISNALVRPDMNRTVAWGYRRWLGMHRWFLDHVVAMTRAMADEAVREMGLDQRRISVIANPLAVSIPNVPPIVMPEKPFLLGVGRLEKQKRWDRLIAAVPLLDRQDVRLTILGEGSLRGMLEAQVAQLGLQHRIFLPGHAADPLPVLQQASVLALTSEYEGVPGVIREALAHGTPVVATDSSVAVREIVAGPAFGTVVPRGDQAALVRALDQWLRPDAVRPAPTGDNGGDPVTDYLDLFDQLTAQRVAA